MYRKRNKELDIISLYTSNYKSQFYLRQISKLAKLPLKTCQNVLLILEKEKLLKSKVEGKNKYFSLNLENIQTKSHILKAEIDKFDNFLKIYPQFKTFLKSIHNNIPIIIFGSFAKGKADKNSDLDLLIMSKDEQNLPFHLLPYKVHRISFSEGSFKKALIEKERSEEHTSELQSPILISRMPSSA